ncbi:MAG: DNA polymerase ligase N-terminal domain-containing protein [Candidatus Bathyarchaeia archaeon]
MSVRISPEPQAKLEEGKKRRIYVVQRHDASHLHYDLRLEMDGVLKSWAVPKTPPEKRGIKRLAIEVEDHPIEYADFEGVIPEGMYGAGTVTIWDRGEYDLLERSEDKIIFNLNGRRLRGIYCLIKFKRLGQNNWLFFKK